MPRAGDDPTSQATREDIPGALSRLLQDLVRAPTTEPGTPWEPWLKPGGVVGRFELVREVGRGGLGVVWEARDLELGRAVAFKAIRPGRDLNAREERLVREAEATARLSHPNIVTLYDVGRAEAGPYLVLELLRGESLASRLERGALPMDDVLRIGVEVSRGLAHAHAKGVVHRDLTPGNVFLCEDGQVKILDLGLAHAFGHRKAEGGTPSYMAPEQLTGAPEDERVDVFALGVILFRALSGKLPFPDEQALRSSHPAPGVETPGDPDVGELIGRMLDKTPLHRPRDGSEVLSALSSHTRDERRPRPPAGPVRLRAVTRDEWPSPGLAKLSRPQLPRICVRERLFHRLDGARQRRVIWLSGGPGAGKTTLLASYAQARHLTSVWFRIDEGDSDPATFFHYLRLAARSPGSRGSPLPALTEEYRGGLSAFARRFFRSFAARLKPTSVVIFDDYHLVAPDSPLHAALAEALMEVPEGRCVVFSSRGDPPPGFGRLRASGMMVLGGEDLRLTRAEARRMGRLWGTATQREIEEAHGRVHGWAAGLVLALAQPGGARGLPPPDGSPSAIFDYFAGEVFGRLDSRTQLFLAEIAALPRVTAEAARAITGNEEAEAILERLVRERYFTSRIAAAAPHYELHPLFQEFLTAQEKALIPAPRRREVLRASAAVVEAQGRSDEALDLLERAEAWDAFADVLRRAAPTLLDAGRTDTLRRWLLRVPGGVLESDPWLLYWLGASQLATAPVSARSSLERAFHRFFEKGERAGSYLAWAAVVDSFVHEWNDFAPLDRWIETFGELQQRWPDAMQGELAERVTVGIFTALIYRQPHHPECAGWERRTLEVARAGSTPRMRMTAGQVLLFSYSWKSATLAESRSLLDALKPLARHSDVDPLTVILWHCWEANYQWMTGAPTAALSAVASGIALSEASGVHRCEFLLRAQGAYAAIAHNDLDAATRFLEDMTASGEHVRGVNAILHGHIRCMLAIRRHDARAVELGRSFLESAHRAGVPYAEVGGVAFVARALIAAGDVHGATLLDEAENAGRRIGNAQIESICLLTRAIQSRHANAPRLVEHVQRLFTFAGQRGFLTHSSYEPSEIADLCAIALEHRIEDEFVRSLIAERHLPAPPRCWAPESWPWPVRIRTLGAFEIAGHVRLGGKDGDIRTGEALSVLQLLVALGPGDVAIERVTEALWHRSKGDVSQLSVTRAVRQLRGILGLEAAVRLHGGFIGLEQGHCWADAWALEQGAREAASAAASGNSEAAAALAHRAAALERGTFLPGRTNEAWVAHRRARLDRARALLTGVLLSPSPPQAPRLE